MLPKVIIIHGLNNSLDAFGPLRDALKAKGFECQLVCLPGHGEDRHEAQGPENSALLFDKTMRQLIGGPYAVIAFSQGALYFQMWLQHTKLQKPIAQVLLAPAIAIRNFSLVRGLAKILPSKLIIKSQLPEGLRRFSYLYVRDYELLFETVMKFDQAVKAFKIPTLIIADTKDELVDARKLLARYNEKVLLLERPYLKGRKPGKYHIVFHPEYYDQKDWDKVLKTMAEFIVSRT